MMGSISACVIICTCSLVSTLPSTDWIVQPARTKRYGVGQCESGREAAQCTNSDLGIRMMSSLPISVSVIDV
jgi:hypothetical protein